MRGRQIERRGELPIAEFMQRYEARSEPVVMTDAAQKWPALRRWSFRSLRARLAGKVFTVRGGARLPFEDIVDRACAATPAAPAPYLSNVDIPQRLPELLDDVQPPMSYARCDRLTSRLLPPNVPTRNNDRFLTFFLGGAGSVFPLHYDFYMAHAFITQIAGEKRFTLFSPGDSSCLYPSAQDPKESTIADVDDVDLERFPLFEKTRRLDITLRAGETIFVPSGWWHATRTSGPSISVGQSAVFGTNWLPFVTDLYHQRRDHWVKANILRLYLLAAAPALWVNEHVQQIVDPLS